MREVKASASDHEKEYRLSCRDAESHARPGSYTETVESLVRPSDSAMFR